MKAILTAAAILLGWSSTILAGPVLNPAPPPLPVKLIFIHHSTGENLLRDDYGGLGLALKTNRYFVSDSNYGWGPDAIGDRTDIPDWPEWFRSAQTPTIMNAVYAESDMHSTYSRRAADPGGPNTIILFKSCFPNSNLEGSPADPPSSDGWLTVGHAKWVYNDILKYFKEHPDKLFVVITAPPLLDPSYAANARAFNQWLVNDWLAENNYPFNNVAIFDFYNVLTHRNAHHRYNPVSGTIDHIVIAGQDSSAYSSSDGDDHPNEAGSQKATAELLPLLNIFYNAWKASAVPHTATLYSDPVNDGWVRESDENSNAGGARNRTNDTIAIGDDASDRQYCGVLSFTANLPSNAVILSATLRIKTQQTVGADPFATHGSLLADVRKNYFGAGAGLAIDDFQAAPNKSAVAAFPASTANGWRKASLTGAGIKVIRPAGVTQFRLRFAIDDDDNLQADYVRIYSGEAASINRPRLILQYMAPGG